MIYNVCHYHSISFDDILFVCCNDIMPVTTIETIKMKYATISYHIISMNYLLIYCIIETYGVAISDIISDKKYDHDIS